MAFMNSSTILLSNKGSFGLVGVDDSGADPNIGLATYYRATDTLGITFTAIGDITIGVNYTKQISILSIGDIIRVYLYIETDPPKSTPGYYVYTSINGGEDWDSGYLVG